MSDDRITRVSVRVLDREYQVACPAEERSDLLDSAEYLDARMREVRDTGKVVGLDRIAVISALNIANELINRMNDVAEVNGMLKSSFGVGPSCGRPRYSRYAEMNAPKNRQSEARNSHIASFGLVSAAPP